MSDLTPSWLQNATASPSLPKPSPVEEPLVSVDEDAPLVLDDVTFPRIASKRIRGMSMTERADWDARRYRAKTDPLYLANVMNMDLVENPHRALFNQFPKMRPGVPMAELDRKIKRRMILWSRGHAKTTSMRVLQVQTLLNYPNARICFLTGSDDLAKRQLNAVKLVFERPTPEFLELFPEYCLTSHQNKRTHEWSDSLDELGTQHQFTIPCRTATVFAEPTFTISTAKKTKAGGHFDFLFCDDLVNDQNYRSAKALEKCYEDFLSLIPLLEPTGYLVVTGTRYSFGDTYDLIIQNAKAAGEESRWKFSIRDCWSTGCMNCPHADVFHDRSVNVIQPPCTVEGCNCLGFASNGDHGVLFPQVTKRDGNLFGFSIDILNSIKQDIGESMFARQYENKVLATGSQIFTSAILGAQTVWELKDLPLFGSAFTFLVGDLAYSEADDKRDRDISVIYTVMKSQGQLYVVDCTAGHFSSNQLVDVTIKLLLAKRPHVVYYEKPVGPADALMNLITARALQVGLPRVPIEWLSAGNVRGSKGIRISNIQAALMSKRLWLYGHMPGYSELCDELQKWPRVKHDDRADALARVCEAPTGYQFEQTPEGAGQSAMDYIRQFNQAHVEEEPDTRPAGSYDTNEY